MTVNSYFLWSAILLVGADTVIEMLVESIRFSTKVLYKFLVLSLKKKKIIIIIKEFAPSRRKSKLAGFSVKTHAKIVYPLLKCCAYVQYVHQQTTSDRLTPDHFLHYYEIIPIHRGLTQGHVCILL